MSIQAYSERKWLQWWKFNIKWVPRVRLLGSCWSPEISLVQSSTPVVLLCCVLLCCELVAKRGFHGKTWPSANLPRQASRNGTQKQEEKLLPLVFFYLCTAVAVSAPISHYVSITNNSDCGLLCTWVQIRGKGVNKVEDRETIEARTCLMVLGPPEGIFLAWYSC